MTTLYKLTNADGQTYGGMQWGPGIEHTAPGTGPLCSAGHIHAYTDPILAVLLDPIHAHFGPTALLWKSDGDVSATDHGLKVGCRRLITIREIPLPQVTLEQRVTFGILCAHFVCHTPKWLAWADGWLDGSDRSTEAAWAAWEAGKAAEWEAWAAWAAEWAAWEAEWAAWAAAKAAAWAAAAARAGAVEAGDIDLIALAHQACGGVL